MSTSYQYITSVVNQLPQVRNLFGDIPSSKRLAAGKRSSFLGPLLKSMHPITEMTYMQSIFWLAELNKALKDAVDQIKEDELTHMNKPIYERIKTNLATTEKELASSKIKAKTLSEDHRKKFEPIFDKVDNYFDQYRQILEEATQSLDSSLQKHTKPSSFLEHMCSDMDIRLALRHAELIDKALPYPNNSTEPHEMLTNALAAHILIVTEGDSKSAENLKDKIKPWVEKMLQLQDEVIESYATLPKEAPNTELRSWVEQAETDARDIRNIFPETLEAEILDERRHLEVNAELQPMLDLDQEKKIAMLGG